VEAEAKAKREAVKLAEDDRIRAEVQKIDVEESGRWKAEFRGRIFTEEEQRETCWENGRTYIGEIAVLLKRARARAIREQEQQKKREARGSDRGRSTKGTRET
jgi:hypothetical protein